VLIKIGRHPADGKRLKIPAPVFSSPKSGREMGLLVVGKHAYHRNERVRECRSIPSTMLISERHNKIAVHGVLALSQASCDLSLDAVHNLIPQGHIIVGVVDIRFEESSLSLNAWAKKESAHCDQASNSLARSLGFPAGSTAV